MKVRPESILPPTLFAKRTAKTFPTQAAEPMMKVFVKTAKLTDLCGHVLVKFLTDDREREKIIIMY